MATKVALKLQSKKRREKCGLWFATKRECEGWIMKYKVRAWRHCLYFIQTLASIRKHLHTSGPYVCILGNISIFQQERKPQCKFLILRKIYSKSRIWQCIFFRLFYHCQCLPSGMDWCKHFHMENRSWPPPLTSVTKPPAELQQNNVNPASTLQMCSHVESFLV